MTILGIGETTLDTSYHLSEFVREDQKTSAIAVTHSVGGPVAAGLLFLRQLDHDCHLISQLGTDPAGKSVEQSVVSGQLQLHVSPTEHTKHNVYLVTETSGTRTGVKSPIRHQPLQLDASHKQLVADAALLLLDRHEPLAAKQALSVLSSKSIAIMDPSTDDSTTTLNLLWQTTLPIAPIELLKKNLPNATLIDGLRIWHKLAGKPIVVTAGQLGCMLFDGQLHLFPSAEIVSIDALGAGDVFRAAVGHGLLQRWSLAQTLQFANLVAGLQCCKPGNGTAIPTQDEISKAQRTIKFRSTSLTYVTQQYQLLRV